MELLELIEQADIISDRDALIFVTEFLTKQNERSTQANGECGYRGYDLWQDEDYDHGGLELKFDGKACAAGCLIKYEFYDPKMEGLGADADIVDLALRDSNPFWEITASSMNMILMLQKVHDNVEPKNWGKVFAEMIKLFDSDRLDMLHVGNLIQYLNSQVITFEDYEEK